MTTVAPNIENEELLDADDAWEDEFELPAGDLERGDVDIVLMLAIAVLVGIGVLAVYSGSSWHAYQQFGDSMHYVRHQLLGIGAGIVALLITNRIDYRWYRTFTRPILAITVILLIATLIPGLGVEVKGARRWLQITGMRFQAAELAKVAVCIFMAYSMDKRKELIHEGRPFLRHAGVLIILIVPLIFQPDFGTSVIVTSIVAVMLYLGGARWSHLVASAATFLVMGMAAIFSEGYRLDRMKTWIDPWSELQGRSWQLVNGWIALARGGVSGTGFGEGYGMFGFVPEMHNDFVAAVVGEEFGWIGFVVFVCLFGIVAWRGYRIAHRCDDIFGTYLAYALTTLIVGQAVINLSVVTGLMPTKGLTLPFVSYGRSSLLVLLTVVGILLNISQNNPDVRTMQTNLKNAARSTLQRRQYVQRWREGRIRELQDYVGRQHEP